MRNPQATPFQSPEWLLPWWDVFSPGELRIIAVFDGETLIGIAPLYRDGEVLRPLGVSLSEASEKVRRIDAMARQGKPWDAVFDTAAAIDPSTAVALYSLGNPRLLRAATDELVQHMLGWGVLKPDAVVLDFGCGTGRVTAAIAPYIARVLGVDASARMVDVARASVARHDNAAIICCGLLG